MGKVTPAQSPIKPLRSRRQVHPQIAYNTRHLQKITVKYNKMVDEFNILVKNQNKLIQLVKSLQESNKSLEDRIISLEFPTTLHGDGDFFSSFLCNDFQI